MPDARHAPSARNQDNANETQSANNGHGANGAHAASLPPAALSEPLGSRGYKPLFRNPRFLRLWSAQVISQTIMNASNYAMIILVSKNTDGSALATGGAVVSFSLPALFLSIPAGLLVDRFDRRTVLWVSNALRAIAAALFVIAQLIARDAIWPVYALTFFIAMVGQFFTPAEGAAIPRLVGRSDLMSALALFNITFTVAQAAGLIILGPLALLFIPAFSIGSVLITHTVSLFVIVTILYAVCAALILSIPGDSLRVRRPTAAERDAEAALSGSYHKQDLANGEPESVSARLRSTLNDIAVSWRFIIQDPALHIAAWQLTLAGVIISIVATIAPKFVMEYFGLSADLAAVAFLPAGIGLVLGSVFTPSVAKRLRPTWTIALGIVVLAASVALLVIGNVTAPYIFGQHWVTNWFYLGGMLILTFLIGVGMDFVNVPAQAILQDRSPDWIKGRVLAVQYLMQYGATVVYVPIIGGLADRFGLSAALICVSLTIGIGGALSIYLRIRVSARAREGLAERVGAHSGAPGGHL